MFVHIIRPTLPRRLLPMRTHLPPSLPDVTELVGVSTLRAVSRLRVKEDVEVEYVAIVEVPVSDPVE